MGTVVYALGIGPLIQLMMRFGGIYPTARKTSSVGPDSAIVESPEIGPPGAGAPSGGRRVEFGEHRAVEPFGTAKGDHGGSARVEDEKPAVVGELVPVFGVGADVGTVDPRLEGAPGVVVPRAVVHLRAVGAEPHEVGMAGGGAPAFEEFRLAQRGGEARRRSRARVTNAVRVVSPVLQSSGQESSRGVSSGTQYALLLPPRV